MKKGRTTKQEQRKRIKQTAGFIFNFRYATRRQLETFMQLIMNLSYFRRLIDYTVRYGFVSVYYDPSFKTKIYYLTKKGKETMRGEEAYVKQYHFEKRHAGINTFDHHNLLVDTYFILKRKLDIKSWQCEWSLRIGKGRMDKIPDGLIVLPDGSRIALEVETSYKTLEAWKTVIELYRYDVEDTSTYHGVLVVAASRDDYEGIKTKLLTLDPELCGSKFILADLSMLESGKCFCHDKLIHLEEAIRLLREGG